MLKIKVPSFFSGKVYLNKIIVMHVLLIMLCFLFFRHLLSIHTWKPSHFLSTLSFKTLKVYLLSLEKHFASGLNCFPSTETIYVSLFTILLLLCVFDGKNVHSPNKINATSVYRMPKRLPYYYKDFRVSK